MTEQPAPGGSPQPPPPPPLPEGMSYPPPPPSSGAVAPPPPGPVVRAQPTEKYTPWATRALAGLIDYIPALVVSVIGLVIFKLLTAQQDQCSTVISGYDQIKQCTPPSMTVPTLVLALSFLAATAYVIWNNGYRQGLTGQSLGKSVMKFKVVSEITGEPLGFGMSVLRLFAHIPDAIIFGIGFLFPLWDAKRQTFADKIMTTVCLPVGDVTPTVA
ncbi:MAG TPA: RDD family protein [Mycobacterium sp.]|nr:RDD family protein [Mycobacterium sp.]HTQ21623.1 RDD family protein [Mycobacterium sp.]